MSRVENITSVFESYRFWIGLSLFLVVVSSLSVALAILGYLPDFNLGLIHLLSFLVAVPNFLVFTLFTYAVIDWRYQHNYKFFTDLDDDGEDFDMIAIAREAMDKWSFTDDQSVSDATRDGPHSEFVMHARNINRDEKIIEPAAEKLPAPADDEVMASPEEHMRAYREKLLKWALKYRDDVLGKGADATATEIEVAQQVVKDIDEVSSRWDSFEYEETAEEVEPEEELNEAVKRLDALEERLSNDGDSE